jgi:hypothetical protein
VNISVLAQIKRTVTKMEAEDVGERRIAWIGTAIVVILLAVLACFYASLSHTTLS